ncbi:hypothetical protein [Maridesulfovibrio ferrireducens]|uniref:hypothetical protein n=1 Tax=Maridesulfovibrio ferrireducens TaxID=246191 RepID=UPI001A2C5673|nr:hypothetical protein [Maridesulfovibrio ferrireducens]MBI9113247.1 hypothetical protein [Maridesulfovibrio ferrireducens]MBI9113276.1 hypothetical protein [Maridesulfovibrio ferrireducens]
MRKYLILCPMAPALFVLLMVVGSLSSGCAFKKLSDLPAEDQAVEYSIIIMESYNATYQQYNEIKSTLTSDQKVIAADFVRAMNLAKPAIVLTARAAESWKTASADDSAKAELKYRQQKLIAADILREAMELWAKLEQGEE